MTMRRLLIILGVFTTSVIAFAVGFVVAPQEVVEQVINRIDYNVDCDTSPKECAFYEVVDYLIAQHYKTPEREELFSGATDGVIEYLDDPYTTYFDAAEVAQFRQGLSETYVGIGVEVSYVEDRIIINDVMAGSPAEDAGLMSNDIITHVNGEIIIDLPFYDVIDQILGEEDTEVIIGVSRPGYDATIHFSILRGVIDNSSIEYEMITEGTTKIGYVVVNTFGADTHVLFSEALADLENQGMDSVIVDVRNNGGGYLSTVYYMLSVFLLNDGNPMFSTETYNNGDIITDDYVSSNFSPKDYEAVVLTNGSSASASEVFASSMQEHGGFTVIGTQTFGKGTMQNDLEISAILGDFLHITLGKWITTDGNWVHYDGGTEGVTPDIVVERTTIEKAFKVTLLNGETILFDTVDNRTANLQVILNEMGYVVRTDGYFDSITKAAIEDIQTNNSLTVDGIIDDNVTLVINDFLDTYLDELSNDTQLQEAVDFLVND